MTSQSKKALETLYGFIPFIGACAALVIASTFILTVMSILLSYLL